MGLFDGLFGTKTKQVESGPPKFQLPYIQQGLSEAQRIYFGGGLPYYGGGAPATGMPPQAQAPGVPQRPGNPGMPATMGPQQPGQPPKAITNLLQFRPDGGGVDGRRDPLYPVPGQPGATYASNPAMAGAQGGSAGPAGPDGVPIQSGIYQGPTVAGLSQATRAGINQIGQNSGGIDPGSSVNALVSALNGNGFGLQNTAAGKSGGFGQAETAAGRNGSFGLGNTASGAMLNANPYLDQVVNNTTRGISDAFRRSTAPGIESAAASRGRLGSGFDLANRRQASESVAQQIGDTESQMRLSNYQTERGLQQQAQTTLGGMQQGAQQFQSSQQQNAQQAMLQQRLQAAGLLPQVLDTANQSALRGGQALMNAGQYVDANNTLRMKDAAERYERTASEPQDRLDRYLASVSGNYGTSQPYSKNQTNETLGTISSIAGTVAQIAPLFLASDERLKTGITPIGGTDEDIDPATGLPRKRKRASLLDNFIPGQTTFGENGIGDLMGGALAKFPMGGIMSLLGGGGDEEGGGMMGGLSSILSDEDSKTARRGPAKMLDAVERMPVSEWQYKPGVADGGAARHVGPMAQDFRRHTGLGDGSTIPVVDAIGVQMAATKELAKRMKRLEKRAR